MKLYRGTPLPGGAHVPWLL